MCKICRKIERIRKWLQNAALRVSYCRYLVTITILTPKKKLEKIDESDKEFSAGVTELNKTMSRAGTAIQQSVRILGQLVGQGMPNHTRMLSPQARDGFRVSQDSRDDWRLFQ